MSVQSIPVTDRFPEHRQAIIERQKTDPDFRDLCTDYNEIIAMLHQAEQTHSAQRGKHYSELIRLRGALEVEILNRLGRD